MTFIGLTNGSIYGFIALGYTLVYGILELINFAHGDVFTSSGLIARHVRFSVSSTWPRTKASERVGGDPRYARCRVPLFAER